MTDIKFALDFMRSKRRSQGILFSKSLFLSLFFVVAACPAMGQANNGIRAHLEGNDLYLSVEQEILDKPILFVRHGVGQHQAIWYKQNNRLVLAIHPIQSNAGIVIPVNQNYKTESLILGRFPIIRTEEFIESNDSYVIEATDLFLGYNIKWFKGYSEKPLVAGQARIIEVIHHYQETIVRTNRMTSWDGSWSNENIDFSFYSLPKDPMESRQFDHRMGFSTEDIMESNPRIGSIMRWRLEKKHVDREISEPIKPITFYFDPEIPQKWKPYIRAGILEWQKPFEAAGFKNAIVVKDFPKQLSVGNLNSMNYSVVRWKNFDGIRGSEEKSGSTVRKYVDFRTGEILKADIILGSSLQSLWVEYFIRCAPLDRRARQFPFQDDLMGELIQSLTSHEAGHAFGLRDGNYGEYSYPFNKMRDKQWLTEMGHTPSIMNYARHNYIVQPEDSVPPSLLIQKVGPMDIYQIKWGYNPLNEIDITKEQVIQLERWILEQDSIPWYRFNTGFSGTIGPDTTNEVVDNDDPLNSTALGLKNIKRVLEFLPDFNRGQPDNILLEQLYDRTINFWFNQMSHVLSLIGGYCVQYKSGEQLGGVFSPVDAELQIKAIEFLTNYALNVPEWLANPEILNRIQYSNSHDKLIDLQLQVLFGILNPSRMKRLERMELKPSHKNLLNEILGKLRIGLFKELKGDEIYIEGRRQNLQKAYIDLILQAFKDDLNYEVPLFSNNRNSNNEYIKSLFYFEMKLLCGDITDNLFKVNRNDIQAHLNLCLLKINNLHPLQTQ